MPIRTRDGRDEGRGVAHTAEPARRQPFVLARKQGAPRGCGRLFEKAELVELAMRRLAYAFCSLGGLGGPLIRTHMLEAIQGPLIEGVQDLRRT